MAEFEFAEVRRILDGLKKWLARRTPQTEAGYVAIAPVAFLDHLLKYPASLKGGLSQSFPVIIMLVTHNNSRHLTLGGLRAQSRRTTWTLYKPPDLMVKVDQHESKWVRKKPTSLDQTKSYLNVAFNVIQGSKITAHHFQIQLCRFFYYVLKVSQFNSRFLPLLFLPSNPQAKERICLGMSRQERSSFKRKGLRFRWIVEEWI